MEIDHTFKQTQSVIFPRSYFSAVCFSSPLVSRTLFTATKHENVLIVTGGGYCDDGRWTGPLDSIEYCMQDDTNKNNLIVTFLFKKRPRFKLYLI